MSRATQKAAAALASKRGESVHVIVRCRPLSAKERANDEDSIVDVDFERGSVSVAPANEGEHPRVFSFDSTYGPGSEQQTIYDTTAAPIVESVLEGFNGTIFCYGQTGAGKTFTMDGKMEPPELRGVMPRAFSHIYEEIATVEDPETQILVHASYLEIYNEQVRDLLAKDHKRKLDIRENADSGVFVQDLTVRPVGSAQEIDQVLQSGKKNRSTGATAMNQESSRSHSIFTVRVDRQDVGADGEVHYRAGKLHLVDLAGSERQSKTHATGDRLREATSINQSLTTLGCVIHALVDSKATHVPYRDSKLTRLLQDSLGGNARTVMCANVSPARFNRDETMGTLRYANRAKNIKNKPKINEDPKDALMREYQDEISRLKQALADAGGDPSLLSTSMEGMATAGGSPVRVVKKDISKLKMKELEQKAERDLKELKERKDLSKQQLREFHAKVAEEKAEIQRKIELESKEGQVQQEEQAEIEAKLLMMQQKLRGNDKMLSQAEQQKSQLRRTKAKLEQQARLQRKMVRKLEKQRVLDKEEKSEFRSMEEECEDLKNRYQIYLEEYQAMAMELRDTQSQQQTEELERVNEIRSFERAIKLAAIIIKNFIPSAVVDSVKERLEWDEHNEEWMLKALQPPINSALPKRGMLEGIPAVMEDENGDEKSILIPNRRPTTLFQRAQAEMDPSPRFRVENCIDTSLIISERATVDFDASSMGQRVDLVFRSEELAAQDIVLFDELDERDEVEEVEAKKPEKPPASSSRPESGSKRGCAEEQTSTRDSTTTRSSTGEKPPRSSSKRDHHSSRKEEDGEKRRHRRSKSDRKDKEERERSMRHKSRRREREEKGEDVMEEKSRRRERRTRG